MNKVLAVMAVLVAAVLLLAVGTPWLVNQDSALTIVFLPFMWVLFGYAAKGLLQRVLRKPTVSANNENS